MNKNEIKDKNEELYKALEDLFGENWDPGKTYRTKLFTLKNNVLTNLCRKHLNPKVHAKFWINYDANPNRLDFELVGLKDDTVKNLRNFFINEDESQFLKGSSDKSKTKIVYINLPTTDEFSNRVEKIRVCIKYFDKIISPKKILPILHQSGEKKHTKNSSHRYYKQDIETKYYDKIWEDTEIEKGSPDIPHKKKEAKSVNNCSKYPRNPLYAKIALEKANYLCEINQKHITFIKKGTLKQFVEAHHLIPIQFHDEFDVSLDVPANIISLCPNCHKYLHYGKQEKVELLLKKLLKERKYRLKICGIDISFEELINLYN